MVHAPPSGQVPRTIDVELATTEGYALEVGGTHHNPWVPREDAVSDPGGTVEGEVRAVLTIAPTAPLILTSRTPLDRWFDGATLTYETQRAAVVTDSHTAPSPLAPEATSTPAAARGDEDSAVAALGSYYHGATVAEVCEWYGTNRNAFQRLRRRYHGPARPPRKASLVRR